MIPTNQLRGIFTQAYTAVYQENIPAPSFLKSFFPSQTYGSSQINLEARRGTEKIATDIIPGTRGNRNTFSNFTAKAYRPPLYKEYFDATELDGYDRVFGQSTEQANAAILGMLAKDVGMQYMELRKKIDRAYEKQSAQALETGLVTLINGDSINYNRKAASLKDNSGSSWATTTSGIESQFITGSNFIRTAGKNGASIFEAIMSTDAWLALKKSDYFTKNANYQNVQLNDIRRPDKVPFGAAYHGTITAGSYIYNIWVYDETYEDDDDNTLRYLDATKVILLPSNGRRFEFSFAAVPAIIRDLRRAEFPEFIGRFQGEFYRTNHIDKNAMAHYFFLLSSGVALPISVDMIYTMKVLTDGQIVGG